MMLVREEVLHTKRHTLYLLYINRIVCILCTVDKKQMEFYYRTYLIFNVIISHYEFLYITLYLSLI